MEDVLLEWCPTKRYFRDGHEFELRVRVKVVRYQPDIEYFFSITCDEVVIINGIPAYQFAMERLGLDVFCHGGCDHDFIGEHFPELIPYFDLHLRDRFGGAFDARHMEIVDPFYTDEDKRIIRDVERRMRLRKYLHARKLIALMRANA